MKKGFILILFLSFLQIKSQNHLQSNLNPIAGFTIYTVCAGENTCLWDSSSSAASDSIISWHWFFGDGDSSFQQNPCHIFKDTLIYQIKLIVKTKNGLSDTAIHFYQPNYIPVVEFEATIYDSSGQVFFTDKSTISKGSIVSWSWLFGDSPPILHYPQNPVHVYSVFPASYTVCLVVESSFGCRNRICKLSDSIITYNPVGIKELSYKNNKVELYPNPFDEFATVKINGFEKEASLLFIVYDPLGRVIKIFDKIHSDKFFIDRDSMGNGIYSFELRSQSRILERGKLIVK